MPKFIYFDLGNVLLRFDHHLACKQMSAVCGLPPEKIWDVVYEKGLKWEYEAGKFTREDYHRKLCEELGIESEIDEFDLAGSAIFEVNPTMVPVVAQLESTGYRLGILSNICESHWRYVTSGQYAILPGSFEVHALSFRIGAIKPDPQVFTAAAELAGVDPGEIFYMDDIPGHVTAAREAGFDAVQYTTTPALVDEMWKRGIRFNY